MVRPRFFSLSNRHFSSKSEKNMGQSLQILIEANSSLNLFDHKSMKNEPQKTLVREIKRNFEDIMNIQIELTKGNKVEEQKKYLIDLLEKLKSNIIALGSIDTYEKSFAGNALKYYLKTLRTISIGKKIPQKNLEIKEHASKLLEETIDAVGIIGSMEQKGEKGILELESSPETSPSNSPSLYRSLTH